MKKPRAFVTGIAGFAGSFLAEELLASGFDVSGALYPGESARNIQGIKSDLQLFKLDIRNERKCRELIARLQPDYIFHLAAMASVGKSFRMEKETLHVNLEGTVNMLDAARGAKHLKALLFVSSPEVYGRFRPVNKTLTETQPFEPISPYGISKAAAESVCRHYWHQYGVPVVIVRAFNHNGPRQTDDFAVPAFARQVAMIEAGLQKPVLKVGDLSARRDLSDVRDIVRGYRLAAIKGTPGEVYQLCSGKTVAIKAVVEQLLAMSSKKIRLQVDRNRLRRAEIPILRGSHRKAAQRLGYEVRYRLKDTLADTLDYWRKEVGSGYRK
ncbi:MAG: GDP-mannose 4,6-dehydratase [candidate division Zixibacteria bacterium]|nr:GDP-mannose 4,6-dehydratase [candidate division Zixibacteria bacterium]